MVSLFGTRDGPKNQVHPESPSLVSKKKGGKGNRVHPEGQASRAKVSKFETDRKVFKNSNLIIQEIMAHFRSSLFPPYIV
jgi:hypothetical protein